MLAGYIRWTDYRGRDAPSAIRITHYKTGAVVLHPLEDADGAHFYADAEPVHAKVPLRGVPIVMHDARAKTEDGNAKPAALYRQAGWRNWSSGCAKSPTCPRHSAWTPAATPA